MLGCSGIDTSPMLGSKHGSVHFAMCNWQALQRKIISKQYLFYEGDSVNSNPIKMVVCNQVLYPS